MTDLIKDILGLVVPSQLQLSPDGSQVVYTGRSKWDHKPKNEEHKRAIWIAETDTENSAHKLTDGTFNDRDPQWSPLGTTVAFLSDRGTRGKSCALYLQQASGAGEPKALTPAQSEQNISKYCFSPDGKHIFFVATPEKSAERKARDEEGADVKVWGEDWDFAHLYRVGVENGVVDTLFDQDVNVVDFALNDDGSHIALVTAKTPDIESEFLHGREIRTGQINAGGLTFGDGIVRFPRNLSSLVWNGSTLYFISNNIPENSSTGQGIYAAGLTTATSDGTKYIRIFPKDEEECCALRLHKAGTSVLVYVQQDMEDQLRLLNGSVLLRQKKKIVDFAAVAANGKDGEIMMVAASGDINKPTEVFAVDTATASVSTQLSSHSAAFNHTFASEVHFLSCPTLDGRETISGIYFTPVGAAPNKALPTYVSIHGGPYYRQTNSFDSLDPFIFFAPLLLSAGIGVLMPEYRGSSSRGQRYASYSMYPGYGQYDQPDIIAMTQHAIDKGLADPNHLGVGGWSQGGYLSYLSAVRNGSHGLGWEYKCAVPGAGITEWVGMSLTSDLGHIQAEGSGALWRMDKGDLSVRAGSALWEFKEAVEKGRIPPLLMLHGQDDARVPVSQAWGFRRALEDAGLPFQLVTYPREGHFFQEKKHLEDMIERVVEFVKGHLL
ncbi:hypothetical protein N0V82_007552 [Gnomoniopsis sp. IMI 355080]|nr:hypothetical protein N0V82_007552 [Gnomoniopsis sp. IMI 355080]